MRAWESYQGPREITGARAHRSPLLSLAVLSYGWFARPCSGNLVFSSLPHRVRPIHPVRQRWLAASTDNFHFMLVDVSRATRAREQLYTAIVSSRRRLSCSRPPERSLERVHISHLFCPSQYSPTVGLRVIFLQKSSFSSCLSLRSRRPTHHLVPRTRASRRPDTIEHLGSGPSPFSFYAGLRHPRTVPPWRLESTNNLGPIP